MLNTRLLICDLPVSALHHHLKLHTQDTVDQDELHEGDASILDPSPNLAGRPSLVNPPRAWLPLLQILIKSLAQHYPTDNSLVRTLSAGHMGQGLFAVKDMPAGTQILSETPLIVVPGDPKERTLAENIAAFCKAVLRVDSNKHHILLIISRRTEYDSQTSEAVQNWFIQKLPKDIYMLEWCVETYSKAFAFYQRHAVGLPRLGASGFFYQYGAINHSCSPNAHAFYDPVKQRHQVQTIRDVKAGGQIFVSYISGIELPRAYRHAEILLEGHKFVCDCTRCTSQEADAITQRVPALYRALSGYLEKVYLRAHQTRSTSLPRNETMEALANAEALLSLFRHPSVEVIGRPLSLALQFCIWFHRDLGNIKAAAVYARERLALHVRLYGFEAENILPHDDATTKLRIIEREVSRMEAGAAWGLPWSSVELREV